MTIKKTLIALAAGAALFGTAALAQFPAGWTKPATGFTVIGNIHYVGTEGLSAWLITSPKGHILIDGGMPQNAALVEANIKALGFKLSDVDLILNSHAHFDHSGALAALKKSTGAVVIASAGDKWALENGKYPGSEDVAAYAFPSVKVDKTVADGEVLTVGGNSLKAVLTPGHSKGCTSWTTTVKDGAKTYRVVFWCSTSVAANRLAPNPQYPGIVDDYRKTFARLGKLEADVFLAPHPEQMGLWTKKAAMGAGKPNPFVDPTELSRVNAKSEADFKAQLANQEAAK
ncbi:subclass B3 metallo-beta-lactamase [Caulobacter sp. SLTY]|uniref:subclass B3 metallo-beta-lactamase n=1 Tax=Caulobacter sp. SLTY TaxID=2683262 RepID=UPI001411D22B|nr:subclass B3 metallo-beta-lactamase [Caulobacter sp. SLTY]NBB17096.1 subclass B3 metallo-beta-lactamase [Caulobacter sp. SLTY]